MSVPVVLQEKLYAGAALLGKEGYPVKLDGSGKVVLATAATDIVIGILDRGGEAIGDYCEIIVSGECTRAQCASNAAAFTFCVASATGLDDTITTGASTGYIVGRWLQSAVSGGQYRFDVNITPMGVA